MRKMKRFKYSSLSMVALQNNPKHQFAMKHALLEFNSNSLYTFIPKNACSTLRFSLAIRNGCIAGEQDFNWIHNNNNTFNPTLKEAFKCQYSFVVLRCPFRRLASVFLDKFVAKDRQAWIYWDNQQRKPDLDELSFSDFVKSLMQPYMFKLDIHWRPQVDFLLFDSYSDYFCLESFSDAIHTLKQQIGFEVHDARHLSGHGIERFDLIEGSNSKLTVQEIHNLKQNGTCPAPESLYSTELVEIVKKLYKDDIDFYRLKFGEDNLLFK